MLKPPITNNGYRLILIAGMLLLTACGDDQTQKDINAYINSLKSSVSDAHVKIKKEVFVLPVKTVYQQEKERSPFGIKQFFSLDRFGFPLQRYSVSMLHFVGTLSENGVIYGYILAPDNLLYPVKVGDKVGDHDGIVTLVDTDRIEIMEKVSEAGKPATQRVITLQLKDEL